MLFYNSLPYQLAMNDSEQVVHLIGFTHAGGAPIHWKLLETRLVHLNDDKLQSVHNIRCFV